MTDIFPINICAYEDARFTQSCYNFRATFIKNFSEQFPKKTWYAYDISILTPTLVEFTVYDMRDNCYGGIGDVVGTFQTTVDPKLTEEYIDNRIYKLAAERREEELLKQELFIIDGYAKEIRKSLEKKGIL